MGIQWLTTMKPSFQIEWLALPPKESRQVLEKIGMTRAMRALLVTIPYRANSPVLKGFKVAYWNLDATLTEREVFQDLDGKETIP